MYLCDMRVHSQKRHTICCKLSILPACCKLLTSCNKLVNFIKWQHACQNQACCNLSSADLLQLVETTCKQTCRQQAMRTHPDIGLLKQVVTRCQQACCNWRVFGCVYAAKFSLANDVVKSIFAYSHFLGFLKINL